MTSLVDKICAYTGKDASLVAARDMLIQPSRNHSPEEMRAKFDRYSVSNEQGRVFKGSVAGLNTQDLFRMARFPNATFWLEVEIPDDEGGHWQTGYLCSSILGQFSVLIFNVEKSQSNPWVVGKLLWKAGDVFPQSFSRKGMRNSLDMMNFAFETWLAAVISINSPRAATVDRWIPPAGQAAKRAQQRGAPLYSCNKVALNLSEGSRQSSDVRKGEPQYSVRAHNVRGHWRLIVKTAEPYWTWVDGFEAGSRERGFVVKDREVTGVPGGLRKGFAVPTHTGRSGERIAAGKAAFQ